MALQIKSKVSTNANGSQAYIEFLNATGVYDADDNPGGFGTPNPSRESLAFFLVGNHQKVSGDVAADILSYNPLTVTSFTVAIDRDVNGVLRYSILAIPIFIEGGLYIDGNVVYDNTNIAAPVIKEMVEGEWVVRTAEELIGNITVTQLNDYTFLIDDAIAYSNLLLKEKLLALRPFVFGGCQDCDRDKFDTIEDRYNYVSGAIIVSTNAFCNQAYNEAQYTIEEVFKLQDMFPNG